MRTRGVPLLLLAAVVCAIASVAFAAEVQQALSPYGGRLTKPTILDGNPLGKSVKTVAFSKLASILQNEPSVARAVQTPVGGEEDTGDIADSKLLGPIDCDKDCPQKERKLDKEIEASLNPDAGVHAKILEKEKNIIAAEKKIAANNGTDDSALGSVQTEIKSLEDLIKHAMTISRQIPEKVRKLEDLKKKQLQLTEQKARDEAAKTLKKHEKLIEEIDSQVAKLQTKINELQSRKQMLISSNAKLQGILSGQGGGDVGAQRPVGGSPNTLIRTELNQLAGDNPL